MPPVAQASLSPKADNSATHVHQIYIKAEPGAIWDAITNPEWNGRYAYRGVSEYELRPGGKFRCLANAQMRSFGLPEVIIDGEVIEVQPPFKLVQTYRFLFSDANKAEGFSRVTFEIEKTAGGFCRLTVTHSELREHANSQLYGGWPMILSGLKTLIETGENLTTPGSLRWAPAA